jgi:hypothetical protein
MNAKWKVLIIMVVCSLLLASCAPGQALGPTFTPTPTATDTATPTPLPTNTPMPTATATEAQCTETGGEQIDIPATDIVGTVSQLKCYDVWSFTMPKGTKINITMSASSSDMLPDFILTTNADDSCASCAEMDTIGTSQDTDEEAVLSYTLPYTGDYYVVVGSLGNPPSGAYSLSIDEVKPTAVPTTKPVSNPPPQNNNTSDNAAVEKKLGTVPVTITNNRSVPVKIVAEGPTTYTVTVPGGKTVSVKWAPGTYYLTAYVGGVYYASTTWAVNENHALFTIN